MQSVDLPNGLTISALNKTEAGILYHEIFIQKSYLKYGIQVCDGDCIFDVGANIGMYTIFLGQLFSHLKIFAFEPIPDIFSALKDNASNYSQTSEIELFNLGLSEQNRVARFEFNPKLSLAASMYDRELAESVSQDATIDDWVKAIAVDLAKVALISPGLARFFLKILSIPLLGSLCLTILNRLVLGKIDKARSIQIDCQLKTVSEIIRENDIAAIDLMKIDTEGSELDVLMGIEAEDWKKIKQFVVEVHNIDDRLSKIVSLFESHRYSTIVDREDWEVHKLMNIFTIYAVAREQVL
jgi:FkbM family methyltransferase